MTQPSSTRRGAEAPCLASTTAAASTGLAGASAGRLHVNELPLPAALVRAMHEGRWRVPSQAVLRRVFRERPIAPVFFDLPRMIVENERWLRETDPAYFGHADTQAPPGDLNPAQSVLIGAMGPELPIALDYRRGLEQPSVVYLHSGGDRWITIARGFRELLSRFDADRPLSGARVAARSTREDDGQASMTATLQSRTEEERNGEQDVCGRLELEHHR